MSKVGPEETNYTSRILMIHCGLKRKHFHDLFMATYYNVLQRLVGESVFPPFITLKLVQIFNQVTKIFKKFSICNNAKMKKLD